MTTWREGLRDIGAMVGGVLLGRRRVLWDLRWRVRRLHRHYLACEPPAIGFILLGMNRRGYVVYFGRMLREILASSLVFAGATLASDQPTKSPTSASAVFTSGDRVKIGTNRDVIEIQGMKFLASEIALPSAPIPANTTLGLPSQPLKSQTPERPKPVSPSALGDQKSAH